MPEDGEDYGFDEKNSAHEGTSAKTPFEYGCLETRVQQLELGGCWELVSKEEAKVFGVCAGAEHD
jgi:hypothetical protein